MAYISEEPKRYLSPLRRQWRAEKKILVELNMDVFIVDLLVDDYPSFRNELQSAMSEVYCDGKHLLEWNERVLDRLLQKDGIRAVRRYR